MPVKLYVCWGKTSCKGLCKVFLIKASIANDVCCGVLLKVFVTWFVRGEPRCICKVFYSGCAAVYLYKSATQQKAKFLFNTLVSKKENVKPRRNLLVTPVHTITHPTTTFKF